MARTRPLSPHLQVYRPQLTSMMSIAHRASGILLTTGTVLLAAWLVALAYSAESYEMVSGLLAHSLGQFVLFGYSAALVYHALNGIRHLAWDLGYGLAIPEVYRNGYVVLLLTMLLTAGLWAAVLF